ncbi:MAG: 6-phosphofructokinase [Puniceicoccales bacterium]|jgi:6-phosphofructokinase 1|nr:6-phosphofructokinase [Puniceicoccales bacterium]
MEELSGNVLILQMGKASAITNAILGALVKKALNYDCIGEIYGCVGGIQGLLSGQFIDLAEQHQKNISNLTGTPGAALKTVVYDEIEFGKLVEILQKYNVRFLFIIGDSSVAGKCAELSNFIKRSNYEMRLMLIPTSSDNATQLTDHCLGYGSMAKHLAVTAKSVITNVQSKQPNGAITILELKGCSSEWLIASLSLMRSRKDSGAAPHLIILSKFDEGTFVKNIHKSIKSIGHCVIAIGDKLTDARGENLAVQHRAAEHIEFIARANFGVQVDLIALSDWELTSCMTLSETDVTESELCAQKALELAVASGISGKMITLLRADENKYSSEVNCVDFENISANVKEFPESWYDYESMSLDAAFFRYAAPLILGEVKYVYDSGLPVFAQLV